MNAKLEDVLRDRFTLKRALATGGKGNTFLAHELQHDRDVILRILPVADTLELEATVGALTFDHPHVLPSWGALQLEGLAIFLSPQIAEMGQPVTLHERLNEFGPLPFSDIILILRGLIRALDVFRERGVALAEFGAEEVHLAGTHARVAPFAGVAAFTLPVASKSVAESLGAIAYRMCCGELPSPGGPPINARRHHMPPGLAHFITCCLADDSARLSQGSDLLEVMATPDPTRAVLHACERGQRALAERQLDLALDAYRDGVDLNPGDCCAQAGLGLTHFFTGAKSLASCHLGRARHLGGEEVIWKLAAAVAWSEPSALEEFLTSERSQVSE
jgi:hypothetical protein